MKSTMKRVKAVVLVCALFMGLLYAPGQMNSVEAASKAYMKKLQVKWDVKNNKSITTQTIYGGIVKKNLTAKISKLKVTKAKKEGYKKLTCTFTVKYPKLAASEVHKIAAKGVFGAGYYYAIVDYDTGYSLETKNQFGVTVKAKDKLDKKKTYRDKDGCWVYSHDVTTKLTITYPEDYKGLCIGFGGYSTLNEKKADQKFWKGKKPFGTTSYYTKNKKNNHFMRVKK